MSIGTITSLPTGTGVSPILPVTSDPLNPANYSGPAKKASDPGEVARQFEAILVRQMLSESMKAMLEHGKDGQVYGYYISEAMADGITKGGGLGLRSILESQLRQQVPSQAASAQAMSPTPSPAKAKKL